MIALLSRTKEQSVVSLKKCVSCKNDLSLEEFYKHPLTADGYMEKCKACHRALMQLNRQKNLERLREYDRNRAHDPVRKKRQARISREWRAADPRRMRCHNAVRRAIIAGKLTKLGCERCDNKKAYAHHDSYDEPLNVMWLCQPCHKQRHKELTQMGTEP